MRGTFGTEWQSDFITAGLQHRVAWRSFCRMATGVDPSWPRSKEQVCVCMGKPRVDIGSEGKARGHWSALEMQVEQKAL